MGEQLRLQSRQQVMHHGILIPPGMRPDLHAGRHNIEAILGSSPASIRKYVNGNFAERGFHVPIAEGHEQNRGRVGLYVPTHNKALRENAAAQVSYLNELRGPGVPALEVFSTTDLQRAEKPLVVIYKNTSPEEHSLRQRGIEIVGPPGNLSDALCNKADSHELIDSYNSPEFRVVNYKVVTSGEISMEGPVFMKGIIDHYEQIGLYSEYVNNNALGVVLRGANSEGGYKFSNIRFIDGSWIVGTAPGQQFTNFNDAFKTAQLHFDDMDQNAENRVVMSRFIDTADAPGMSVIAYDGQLISLGWNRQTKGEQFKCEGTTTYAPSSKHEENVYSEFKDKLPELYQGFLQWVAPHYGHNFEDLRMIVNVDFMVPTPLEFEQQKRSGELRHLPVAELNFRLTDWTNAVLGGALFGLADQTPHGMLGLIDRGVTTIRKYPVPGNVDPWKLREQLGHEYKERPRENGLVVLRYAPQHDAGTDQSLGVVIYGDEMKGKETIDQAITSVAV